MNRLLVVRNRSGPFLCTPCTYRCLCTMVVRQRGRIGPEHRSYIEGKRTTQHSATHVLGLPNTKSDCKGTLSTHDNVLRFQQSGKTVAQVDIASVRDVFLGEESKQVGGLPMKIGKAAAPYGGGRLVSLFAHKRYDTLTLEYVDGDGGVHGAIFLVTKGQGELSNK